ncbi:unnamed protein product [Brassica oleracea var. botrytis]
MFTSALVRGCVVLDKPIVEKPCIYGRESELYLRLVCPQSEAYCDYLHLLWLRKSKKMDPSYTVILDNDKFNKREYVVQVLMKIIPGMPVEKTQ